MMQTFSGDPAYEVFYVRGIFKTGHPDVDHFVVLVHISDLRKIMAQEIEYFQGRTSSVVLTVHPARLTPVVARRLKKIPYLAGYDILTWEEMAPDLKALLQLNQATWTIFILILFLVSIVSNTNVMLMSVMERIREFGLLTAMGMGPITLMAMVFLEALFIGILGGTSGAVAGILASVYFARKGLDLSLFQKGLAWLMGEDTRVFIEFPVLLLISLYLSMLFISVLSAMYPACKASRVDPVEAMRFA
ncbi:MAG: ABC transporter permease [bacterium]